MDTNFFSNSNSNSNNTNKPSFDIDSILSGTTSKPLSPSPTPSSPAPSTTQSSTPNTIPKPTQPTTLSTVSTQTNIPKPTNLYPPKKEDTLPLKTPNSNPYLPPDFKAGPTTSTSSSMSSFDKNSQPSTITQPSIASAFSTPTQQSKPEYIGLTELNKNNKEEVQSTNIKPNLILKPNAYSKDNTETQSTDNESLQFQAPEQEDIQPQIIEQSFSSTPKQRKRKPETRFCGHFAWFFTILNFFASIFLLFIKILNNQIKNETNDTADMLKSIFNISPYIVIAVFLLSVVSIINCLIQIVIRKNKYSKITLIVVLVTTIVVLSLLFFLDFINLALDRISLLF